MASYAAAVGSPKMQPSKVANTHGMLDNLLADDLELDEVREVAETADALERVAAAVQAEVAETAEGWEGTETRTPFVGHVTFMGLGFSVVNGDIYVPNAVTAEVEATAREELERAECHVGRALYRLRNVRLRALFGEAPAPAEAPAEASAPPEALATAEALAIAEAPAPVPVQAPAAAEARAT